MDDRSLKLGQIGVMIGVSEAMFEKLQLHFAPNTKSEQHISAILGHIEELCLTVEEDLPA